MQATMKPAAADIRSYTAEELDALFRAGTLERIGMGMRRACYRLPCGKMCVKCYRSDDEIGEGKYPGCAETQPLSRAVVKEIKDCRFSERRNTSCQEYRYWENLRGRLNPDVFSIFPKTLECVLVPSRGWCMIEEIVRNSDGTDSKPFAVAYRAADDSGRVKLLTMLNELVTDFIASSVRLYDPQNLVVQTLGSGGFKLRVVDFEPVSRCFIPVDSVLPFLVRMKTRRRVKRYLREQLGVRGVVKCAIM